MTEERRFKSVRGKLTPEQKRRLRASRAWAEKNKPAIDARALAVKAQMNLAHAAMQMLKREREARGLSLAAIAQGTGMDKSNLSRLENDPNANPTLETLSRIATAIGVKLTIGVAA
jgi:ribosome-binding protein aMBF1 (putative translation factor)